MGMSLVPVGCSSLKIADTSSLNSPHDPPEGEVGLKKENETKLTILKTCYVLGNAHKLTSLNPERSNHPSFTAERKSLGFKCDVSGYLRLPL